MAYAARDSLLQCVDFVHVAKPDQPLSRHSAMSLDKKKLLLLSDSSEFDSRQRRRKTKTEAVVVANQR